MQQLLDQARDWVDADAPVIWLLGKTQAGKTSIVAEMTGQAHDQVGAGYRPMTRENRIYAFPEERPVLRFLDTRGLCDSAEPDLTGTCDPDADLALAQAQAHLVMAVLRVDDLALTEILAGAARGSTATGRPAADRRPDRAASSLRAA
jgi:predicted GTPase